MSLLHKEEKLDKEIVLLFAEAPFGSNHFSEKLRMALGLSLLDENRLTLIFMDASSYALGKLDEASAGLNPISKNINMLLQLGASLFAESDDSFSYSDEITGKVKSINAGDVEPLLEKADVVIT